MAVTMNATMLSGVDVYFGPGDSEFLLRLDPLILLCMFASTGKKAFYYNITYMVTSTGQYKRRCSHIFC